MKRILIVAFWLVATQLVVKAQKPLDEAIKLTESEKYVAAKKAFATLLANKPDEKTYYYCGENYFESGNLDSASYYYQQGIKLFPKKAINYAGAGKISLAFNRTTEANFYLDKALTLSKSKDAEVLTQVAKAYVATENNRDIRKALECLEKAENVNPKYPGTYPVKGDVHLMDSLDMGRAGLAMSAYEKMEEFDKNSPKVKLKKAKIMMSARNVEEAEKNCKEALELDATYAPAHRQLGDIYLKAKKYDEAAKSYAQYCQLLGNDITARATYAKALFAAGNYSEAIKEANKILEAAPNDPTMYGMYRIIAYSYYKIAIKDKENAKESDLDAAQKAFEKLFVVEKADKITVLDYYYYANLLSHDKVGKDSLACIAYKKCIQKDTTEKTYPIYSEMGTFQLRKGMWNGAIESYNSKAKVTSLGDQDKFRLGLAYLQIKNYPKADSVLALVTNEKSALYINYYRLSCAMQGLDVDYSKGTGKPLAEKVLELSATDTTKYTKEIKLSRQYLMFYNMVKQDWKQAEIYAIPLVAIDPQQFNEKLAYIRKQLGKN